MERDDASAAVTLESADLARMSRNERIKIESKGLFFVSEKGEAHTFLDEIEALNRGETPTLSNTAKELSKFFGIYKQQLRGERGKKTDDYSFMARIKAPAGGRISARQWAALDDAADLFADGSVRITSRQGVQYHQVKGPKLGALIRHLNREYRDEGTLGACGDVNRNVMASPIDDLDPLHRPGALELAHAIADELAPRSTAYFQIFNSDEEGRNSGPLNSTEPIYGEHYLPRKFKIGIAHPTDNSVDVLTQDVGFVPVVTNGACDGSLFDVYTGGGLGLSHNNPKTAALLGLHVGRVRREQVVDVARGIVLLQKEKGERKDRKQARWKYTIRRIGVEAVQQALRERFEIDLEDVEPQPLPPMELHLGWNEQRDGRHWYGVSVQSGRLKGAQRKAVRQAVESLGLTVVLTPQQDVLLCDVEDRAAVERIFEEHGVAPPESVSRVRRNAMACPAKPTCGLAMTDAENVLPQYVTAIEEAGLGDVDAVIRMTGCPNNCARPPTAEIGIYGYGKNDHVILVGGARDGSRIGKPLYGRIAGEQMVPALVGLFRILRERNPENLPVDEYLHRADPAELRGWIGIEDRA